MAPVTPHHSHARRSYYDADEDDNLTEEQRQRRNFIYRILNTIKIAVFILIWLYFTIFIIITPPHKDKERVVSLDPNEERILKLIDVPDGSAITVKLRGNIDEQATFHPNRVKQNQSYVEVTLTSVDKENKTLWTSRKWLVYLEENTDRKVITVSNDIKMGDSRNVADEDSALVLNILNTGEEATALCVVIHSNPMNLSISVLYAVVLLLFLYTLIIFDIADRTFAALLSATLGIGVLCMMNERPDLGTIISWIDMDTLMLLFGMMVIISVMAETGIFDYLSVFSYRLSKGQPWVMIFLLCMLTVTLSAFLDNVTIIMLMVPVIIRLTECMSLRTTTVLISVTIFSNIGGALTPVGDPPNVIIATNAYVAAEGVDFVVFVSHMFGGVFFSIVVTWFYLYVVLRKNLFDGGQDQMRESIKNLTKHAAKLNAPTPSEIEVRNAILKRIEELKLQYQRKQAANSFGLTPAANYIETLAEMETKYKVRNKPLLIKCFVALIFAVLLFSLHSLPLLKGVTLAWAAMLAAILLLILANRPDLEVILDQVEWSTLLFFAGLFVLVECVSILGLIDYIGEWTISLIQSVSSENRLVVSMMLVLWISAVFSTFVDNIPIVTMMLKLAIKLSQTDELHLPMLPLIWALSFGVCFGGNGTLIAASSNVVAAGIANQHGYKITFMEFFKYGFPVTIITTFVASIYLLIAHGLFHWHNE